MNQLVERLQSLHFNQLPPQSNQSFLHQPTSEQKMPQQPSPEQIMSHLVRENFQLKIEIERLNMLLNVNQYQIVPWVK